MSLSRLCDSCDNIIDGTYFDLMITPKQSRDTPEQDAEHWYGDFCINCINSGKAVEYLMKNFKKRLKKEK